MKCFDPETTKTSGLLGASSVLAVPRLGLQEPSLEEILQGIVTGSPSERLAGLASILARGTEETVPVLLKAAASPNIPLRIEAIRLLGALTAEEAVETMTRTLSHSDPRLRREALLALDRIGTDGHLEAQLRARLLRKDPDHRVRLAADLILSETKVTDRTTSKFGRDVGPSSQDRPRALMLARVMQQEIADGADRRWGSDEAGKVAALLERIVTSALSY